VIAFLFPGQGAQQPGMLRDLSAIPGGAALVDHASRMLGRELTADDTPSGYAGTAAAQRALFVAGVASARALIAGGVRPQAVAGHSVGAFAAAVIAGALDFEAGLRAVDLRGEAMAAAFPTGYGMGVIGGLDADRVEALAAAYTRPAQPVYAANVNAPDQIAIAGSRAAVDAVLAAARAAGARSARVLDVCVPSHTPLMRAITPLLAGILPTTSVRAAGIAYAANRTGRIVRDAARIRADLISNAEHPVRWADATTALYESGVRTFIEMRPGSILTDLATAAFADARAIALETSTLAATIALGEHAARR